MKKLFKSIIAAMLCAIIAISAIGTDTACAAEKEMIMNVKFNKKTIDVRKKSNLTLKNLKSKWGKPKKSEDEYNGTTYTWKKGKTTIEYGNSNGTYICVDIADKNATICGIKVGMKKDEVLKKLKKLSGKSVVVNDPTVEDVIHVDENPEYDIVWMPVTCIAAKIFVKDGKVTRMYYACSYES